MVLQRPRQWGRAQHYSSEPCVGVDDDISEAADARVELRRARLHHQNIAGRHILPCGHEADLGGGPNEIADARAPERVLQGKARCTARGREGNDEHAHTI